MKYQLENILQKCGKTEAVIIIEHIDSYFNFTDDRGLKKEISGWRSGVMPPDLAHKIETEIRYLASSDIAYAYRKIRGKKPAGIDIHEILDDIAKEKKLAVPKHENIERRFELLAQAVFENEILAMTPEEQRYLFEQTNEKEAIGDILRTLKNRPTEIFSVLLRVMGSRKVLEMLQSCVLSNISTFIGKKAAGALIKEVLTRAPWLASMYGPVSWAASVGWFAADMAAPAKDKVFPIMLMLALVSLRDGPEAEGE